MAIILKSIPDDHLAKDTMVKHLKNLPLGIAKSKIYLKIIEK